MSAMYYHLAHYTVRSTQYTIHSTEYTVLGYKERGFRIQPQCFLSANSVFNIRSQKGSNVDTKMSS